MGITMMMLRIYHVTGTEMGLIHPTLLLFFLVPNVQHIHL